MSKFAKKFGVDQFSDNSFKTIGDVSSELDIPQHVLRFWESKFAQIKPMKRKGKHRYYRPEDLEVIKKIQTLLHVQGYTIKGAQKYLKDSKKTGFDTNTQLIQQSNVTSLEPQGNLFGGELVKSEKRNIKKDKKKLESFLRELELVKEMLNSN